MAKNGASARVADLRQLFDESFASLPLAATEAREDFIAVRVGGDPYALKVKELSGVLGGKRIVSLPSRRASVVGIVGVRGVLVPVYSLAVLLGYPADEGVTRWLALSNGADPVGFAFQAWEGTLRLGSDDLYPVDRADAKTHVRELVRAGGVVRPVVSIDAAVQALKRDAGAAGPTKEP